MYSYYQPCMSPVYPPPPPPISLSLSLFRVGVKFSPWSQNMNILSIDSLILFWLRFSEYDLLHFKHISPQKEKKGI